VAVPPPANAPSDEAVIELTGGSLKGSVSGQGTASVKARVTSHGARKLLGVRIAAYYDVIDALPAPDARWHLHEFLFEPPLTAGANSNVAF